MRFSIPFAILLATSACQVQTQAPDNSAARADDDVLPASNGTLPETPSAAVDASAPAPVDPDVPPPPHMNADGPTPAAEASAMGAARRLQEYCDAVATKRYADAYRYWNDSGKATGMTLAEFRGSFGKYAAYDCHIGPPGRLEGAAGSVYVTIPLQVTGALARGGGFLLEGPVTMRRVNDVDGSTAEQRRWHISDSGLKPRP